MLRVASGDKKFLQKENPIPDEPPNSSKLTGATGLVAEGSVVAVSGGGALLSKAAAGFVSTVAEAWLFDAAAGLLAETLFFSDFVAFTLMGSAALMSSAGFTFMTCSSFACWKVEK